MSKKTPKEKYSIFGCIGCQVCTNIAPGVFKMNDNGLAEVKDQKADAKLVNKAVDECPVDAIGIN